MVDLTENQEESIENRRRHFRLEYPPGERPMLKVRKYEFDVVDISQSGLRFLDDQGVKLGKWVSGIIIFPDGATIERDSKIIWNYQNVYGIEFLIRIPFKFILEQQKRLIKFNRQT
jgi:hypothetical protein